MENHIKQTTAITPEALLALGGPALVYVRALSVDEMRDIPGVSEAEEGPSLYSIHAGDGTRIAVVGSRAAAFLAARQNDMEPVSVH